MQYLVEMFAHDDILAIKLTTTPQQYLMWIVK